MTDRGLSGIGTIGASEMDPSSLRGTGVGAVGVLEVDPPSMGGGGTGAGPPQPEKQTMIAIVQAIIARSCEVALFIGESRCAEPRRFEFVSH